MKKKNTSGGLILSLENFGLIPYFNFYVTSDARYFIVDLVMGILRLFLVIFLPTTLLYFTKLRFRWSFWGAQHVKILIGSKAMAKNKNVLISVFLPFFKTKS